MKANICQQIKKDSCDGSNVNYLETQSSTGEEKEQEYKPVVNGVHSRVDNQSADNTYNNGDATRSQSDTNKIRGSTDKCSQ